MILKYFMDWFPFWLLVCLLVCDSLSGAHGTVRAVS
jgi:hypothetical protein